MISDVHVQCIYIITLVKARGSVITVYICISDSWWIHLISNFQSKYIFRKYIIQWS